MTAEQLFGMHRNLMGSVHDSLVQELAQVGFSSEEIDRVYWALEKWLFVTWRKWVLNLLDNQSSYRLEDEEDDVMVDWEVETPIGDIEQTVTSRVCPLSDEQRFLQMLKEGALISRSVRGI